MGILKRLRDRIDAVTASSPLANAASTLPEKFAFTAAIPGGAHGSICKVAVQVLREPQQDGERVHLRAHFQTNLASVLKPALQQARGEAVTHAASGSTMLDSSSSRAVAPVSRAARVASRGLQRVLSTPLVERITAPLLTHDFNTWMELQASTEPLNDGAHSLVPQQEKLAALGIRPTRGAKGKGPMAENWASQSASGHAQLSLLQVDRDSLPPEMAKALGKQPFQFAAAILNTAERK